MRNSNCRQGRKRQELCALLSSSAKRHRFSVDNTDGQVDTPEGKNLFHATAMSVYQRKPKMDDRAYLTVAQNPDSYLPPTIITDGMAVVHELSVNKSHIDNCQDVSAFFIRAIENKSFGYCEACLLFDDYSTVR